MLKEYRKPLDFEKFLHVGMLLQGDAIKIAIESHRRNMPYCMGSLFWQHNDCWPVASWSSRDYYGNWKAQHYFAKKAFKDILVTSTIKDNKLDVYCVSDRLIPSNGILEVTSMTLDGKVVYSERKLVTVDSNSSKLISEYDLNLLKKSYDNNNLMVYLKLFVDGIDYDNIRLLSSNKDLNLLKPDISVDFEDKDCAIELILSSKVFVRGVYLSIPDANYFFEDNYFDIVPGLEKKVLLKTDKSVDYLKKYLKITSLFDSYNN